MATDTYTKQQEKRETIPHNLNTNELKQLFTLASKYNIPPGYVDANIMDKLKNEQRSAGRDLNVALRTTDIEEQEQAKAEAQKINLLLSLIKQNNGYYPSDNGTQIPNTPSSQGSSPTDFSDAVKDTVIEFERKDKIRKLAAHLGGILNSVSEYDYVAAICKKIENGNFQIPDAINTVKNGTVQELKNLTDQIINILQTRREEQIKKAVIREKKLNADIREGANLYREFLGLKPWDENKNDLQFYPYPFIKFGNITIYSNVIKSIADGTLTVDQLRQQIAKVKTEPDYISQNTVITELNQTASELKKLLDKSDDTIKAQSDEYERYKLSEQNKVDGKFCKKFSDMSLPNEFNQRLELRHDDESLLPISIETIKSVIATDQKAMVAINVGLIQNARIIAQLKSGREVNNREELVQTIDSAILTSQSISAVLGVPKPDTNSTS